MARRQAVWHQACLLSPGTKRNAHLLPPPRQPWQAESDWARHQWWRQRESLAQPGGRNSLRSWPVPLPFKIQFPPKVSEARVRILTGLFFLDRSCFSPDSAGSVAPANVKLAELIALVIKPFNNNKKVHLLIVVTISKVAVV